MGAAFTQARASSSWGSGRRGSLRRERHPACIDPWIMDPIGADVLRSLGHVGLAALLGAFIGCEREWAGKPAGLRTHMLVGGAAAMFVLLGFSAVEAFPDPARMSADPIRVLQAILVGVSFLGAGTILRDGSGNVEGLTTAASILVTSGVGTAVALGHSLFATLVCGVLVVAVFALGVLERWLERARGRRDQGSKA